jgi:hypothetical protein
MTTKRAPRTQAQLPAAPSPPINITASAREGWKRCEREIATYLRELPRLLAEGHIWQHALVKGDEVLSVWETQGDAIQAGCERFGTEPVFVKTIDPRDPERYALFFAEIQKGSSCPS